MIVVRVTSLQWKRCRKEPEHDESAESSSRPATAQDNQPSAEVEGKYRLLLLFIVLEIVDSSSHRSSS